MTEEISTGAPAERLREKLVHGSGRWFVAVSVVLVWLLDHLVCDRIAIGGVLDPALVGVVTNFEWVSTLVMLIVSTALLYALFRPLPRLLLPAAAAYLGVSVLQVAANVLSMVLTAHVKSGSGLTTLWDVAAVYGMSVVVFDPYVGEELVARAEATRVALPDLAAASDMFVYLLLDVSTPGGAFVWPSREGQAPPTPHLLDYLFISLNVNSTYGPTSEALMSRPGKLVMALQTLLAIMMLTVLIARAVGATS